LNESISFVSVVDATRELAECAFEPVHEVQSPYDGEENATDAQGPRDTRPQPRGVSSRPVCLISAVKPPRYPHLL
jgi:hypothetical protein